MSVRKAEKEWQIHLFFSFLAHKEIQTLKVNQEQPLFWFLLNHIHRR